MGTQNTKHSEIATVLGSYLMAVSRRTKKKQVPGLKSSLKSYRLVTHALVIIAFFYFFFIFV